MNLVTFNKTLKENKDNWTQPRINYDFINRIVKDVKTNQDKPITERLSNEQFKTYKKLLNKLIRKAKNE